MTNQEYRRSRGTHKPFTTTPEQASRIMRQLYAKENAKIRGKVRKTAAFASRCRRQEQGQLEEQYDAD